MKKFLIGLCLGLILATSGMAFAAQSIKVLVNGKEVKSDVPAQIVNGRTMVPLRAVSEALGANVGWDGKTYTVSITASWLPSEQTATTTAPAVKTYKAGTYKIGTDMPAGEYVLIADGMSYFQVSKDSTGQWDSITANDNFTNRSIVSVENGQYLKLQNCTAYTFKDAPKVQSVGGFLTAGMYKVGVDLPANEYKVIADGMAYIEVSKDSSHDMYSIISNDNFEGETYITVENGQYLKMSGSKLKLNQ